MGFIPIIDRNLPVDARRIGPTHGEAVAAMVVCLLQGVRALYRMEQFAAEEPVLGLLFPQYDAKAWHDDHLGDTLDAIWTFGPGALQGAVTGHLLQAFGVQVAQIHDDTTSFKVVGRYETEDETSEAQDTGAEVPPAAPAAARQPVRLVPGHSKDHRPDLNQVKGGLAVSADGGVPLLWEAQDGNRADVSTSVEYWLQLKEVVGRTDFLCVGDCQLASQDNLIAIMQQQGRFLAPLPGYAGIQAQLEEWVVTNTVEELLLRRPGRGQQGWYRGFRRPYVLVDTAGRQYPCDVHSVCNPQLQAEKQVHLEHRLRKTQAFLEGLPKRLGKRALKSREAIEQALDATLQRYRTDACVSYRLVSTERARKRYRGRGRPGAEAAYDEVTETHWTVEWQWLPEAIEQAKLLGGYFPLITNDPALTTVRALGIYKEQYHPEQRFKWLKGAGILAPVLLKRPHRIAAFFCVGGLVLQLLTLVEREAARQIATSGKPLLGLKPNRLPDDRPTTEALLHAFRHVTVTQVILADHPAERVISPLNLLQTRILRLLGLEESIDTWEYLSRSLVELDSSESLAQLTDQRNVGYNVFYIAQLLKQLGFSDQKAAFVSDHLNEAKRQEWCTTTRPQILTLAKAQHALLLCGDEASFPQWGTLSYTWARRGHQPMVKTSGKRKGYKVFGVIEYFTGRFWYQGQAGRLNSEAYIEFLTRVLEQATQPIMLIQDGARYHTSAAMQRFFALHTACLTVFRLPSYSPEYNPIEKLWKKVKKEGTHLQDFPTFEALTDKVEHALLKFANTPEEILSLCSLPTELAKAA